MTYNDPDTDASAAPDPNEGAQALQNAAPAEADAHKDMLSEALGMLNGQGFDLGTLAQKFGLPHLDLNNMNPAQMVQLTQQLAQQHPEVVAEVVQRYPAAQGIVGYLTGGGNSGGGGFLSGLLGKIL